MSTVKPSIKIQDTNNCFSNGDSFLENERQPQGSSQNSRTIVNQHFASPLPKVSPTGQLSFDHLKDGCSWSPHLSEHRKHCFLCLWLTRKVPPSYFILCWNSWRRKTTCKHVSLMSPLPDHLSNTVTFSSIQIDAAHILTIPIFVTEQVCNQKKMCLFFSLILYCVGLHDLLTAQELKRFDPCLVLQGSLFLKKHRNIIIPPCSYHFL